MATVLLALIQGLPAIIAAVAALAVAVSRREAASPESTKVAETDELVAR